MSWSALTVVREPFLSFLRLIPHFPGVISCNGCKVCVLESFIFPFPLPISVLCVLCPPRRFPSPDHDIALFLSAWPGPGLDRFDRHSLSLSRQRTGEERDGNTVPLSYLISLCPTREKETARPINLTRINFICERRGY